MAKQIVRASRGRVRVRRAVVALLTLSLIGYVYQQIAESLDFRRYPPPGQLVDIGDIRIHLFCEGEGSPTVIAEAGAGSSSLSWNSVRPAIAQVTRMCVYDRAGFGWSDYESALPTRERVLSNVSSTLKKAEVEGPYVLVGHSLGGIYVRDFAEKYPNKVSGMVLVDSSHENQLARMPAELREMQASSTRWLSMAMPICHVATAVGLVRAVRLWSFLGPSTSEETSGPFLMARNRTEFCPAMRGALLAYSEALDQEREPQPLGALPLMVLSHGRSNAGSEAEEEWEETWSVLQKELAELSSNSTHRVVKDAGHGIQFDRPDAVIDAILDVVEASR